MNDNSSYVIGVDFGTLSGRAVVVRVTDGAELGTGVTDYPHAVLDRALPAHGGSVELPPDWALQVASDYVHVLKTAVPEAISQSGVDPADVIGIGTDFTACTLVPVAEDGTPLAELPGWSDRPHAYTKLWRHHSAQPQADRITELAAARGESWLARYGGRISSEWEFAKALQVLEEDPEVYDATHRFVEAADWIVWQLCGQYVRNACSAGYKGIYQDGHYPDEEFLAALNPRFASFVHDKLQQPIGALGAAAGRLCATAAAWTGLPEGIAVAVGNVDAHVTAAAADACSPGQMTAIMGTSTCHVMNGDRLVEVSGMCGAVDGGITSGLWGYEAGQSGVGDIFGWFTETGVPGSYQAAAAERGVSTHEYLTELAAAQPIGGHGLVALDWHSGNRSVLVDHELSAVVVGQTLATRPEDTYRALLEATAFGTRTIVAAFRDAGVPVTELVVAGGLLKNRFLMQLYADVTRLPLSTITSTQGPALGSAIHAAVAAGSFPDVPTAARAMGGRTEAAYVPNEEAARRYDLLFAEYTWLHDHFGRPGPGRDLLHRLRAVRRAAHSAGEPEPALAAASTGPLTAKGEHEHV